MGEFESALSGVAGCFAVLERQGGAVGHRADALDSCGASSTYIPLVTASDDGNDMKLPQAMAALSKSSTGNVKVAGSEGTRRHVKSPYHMKLSHNTF